MNLRALLPQTLFGRIFWLIVGVVFAVLLIGGMTLRRVSIDPGGQQMADLIAGQIAAARVLARAQPPMGGDARGGAAVLDLRWASTPPAAAERAWLPFLRRVEQRLQERLGPDTRLRVQHAPESRLWVRLPAPDTGWVGLAVPPFAQQALSLSLTVSVAALLLALLGALWIARRIARPLERLACAAPGLARGEFAADVVDARAARELRALDDALAAAAASVRAAGRDRELLLAGVSHDLRTPLARLRLAMEMDARDAGLREQMEADIAEIDASIAQFLDFVRDGREEPVERRDLVALAHEVAASAAGGGHDWRVLGDDGQSAAAGALPADVRPRALARALGNLLRNAVVHGAAPREIVLARVDGDVLLTVRDAGPGVPDAELAQLAQPFRRGAGSARRSGTGLGLASAERVAVAHGGRLALRNRPGGGFEAQLRLPSG